MEDAATLRELEEYDGGLRLMIYRPKVSRRGTQDYTEKVALFQTVGMSDRAKSTLPH